MKLTATQGRALHLLEKHRELTRHRGRGHSCFVVDPMKLRGYGLIDAHGSHWTTIRELRRAGFVTIDRVSRDKQIARLTRDGRVEFALRQTRASPTCRELTEAEERHLIRETVRCERREMADERVRQRIKRLFPQ